MNNVELLSIIKMGPTPIAGYGEGVIPIAEIKCQEFYKVQKDTIDDYRKYIDRVMLYTTNIKYDMEIKVLTKIPKFPESLPREFEDKFKGARNTITDITKEELLLKDVKDIVTYPQVEEVTSLSSYVEKYSIFVKGMKMLASSLKEALDEVEKHLLFIMDSDKLYVEDSLKTYLNSMRIIRQYEIELVRFGEAFIETLDD